VSRVKVSLVFGTRPEAIKLAPIHAELSRRQDRFETSVVVTAQHRQMLDQMLAVFRMLPDVDLNVMEEDQSLTQVTTRVLAGLEPVLGELAPDIILVQGDTTTVFAASLAAFYQRIKVGHVEAGLRTHNKFSPFPEETNRRLTGQMADVHFAATERARQNLLRADVKPESIFVTGNPVVDALQTVRNRGPQLSETEFAWVEELEGRLILVTAHRRENLGVPLTQICEALKQIAADHRDVTIIYAVHPNPAVRDAAYEILDDTERVVLCDPPDYLVFVALLLRADLIITDSGGLQEEGPALGIPVLVTRDTTERPEGIEAGVTKLVGTQTDAIVTAADELLTSPAAYQAMSTGGCPYGDGRAAERICDALEYVFQLRDVPPDGFVYERGGPGQ